MIGITVMCNADMEEAIQLTVDPAQRVHEVVAEAFQCESELIQQVLLGEMDVLDGESFEDHGIEVNLHHQR